jgi:ankyrin repeat protein
LQAVACQGNTDEVARLLDQRADVKATSSANGESALAVAAGAGHVEVIQLLLDHQASTERGGAGRNDTNALAHAVRGRKLAAARMLLANQAGVNTADANGITPLIHAARDGLFDFTTLLLSWGATLEDTCPSTETSCVGETPFYVALKAGFYNNANQLLQANANVELTDSDGYTPLYYSAKNGLIPFVDLLITAGANVEATDTSEEYPVDPWSYDPRGSEPPDYQQTDPRGVSFLDQTPITVLYHAVRNGQPLVVQKLLDASANVETVDSVGLTPFWYAALNGHQVIMSALIAKGANIEIKDLHDFTPLAMASTYNRQATVNYLIANGASKVGLLSKEVKNYLGVKFFEKLCPQAQGAGCPWRDDFDAQTWTLQNLLEWRGFSDMVTLLT